MQFVRVLSSIIIIIIIIIIMLVSTNIHRVLRPLKPEYDKLILLKHDVMADITSVGTSHIKGR